MGNSMDMPPIIKNRTTIKAIDPNSGHVSEGDEISILLPESLSVFIASFTIARISNQLNCSLMDEWKNKSGYMYIMDYLVLIF